MAGKSTVNHGLGAAEPVCLVVVGSLGTFGLGRRAANVIPLTVREAPRVLRGALKCCSCRGWSCCGPAGECEESGGTLVGIAVHIGSRVLAIAQPGEVLVSSTVTGLVTGSRIEFDDRGEHTLKGIAGPWHLYSARTP